MNIVYYRYDYEYFTNLLSLKMEIRDGSTSLYESVFSRLFGVGVIDRTKQLPRAINTIVLSPIPSFLEDIGTYDEIVKDNAKRIKSTLTLPPMMYYDGSIDATVALLGMIDEDIDNMTLNISEETYESQKQFIDSLNCTLIINNKKEYGDDIKKYNIISYALGKVINDCDFIFNISDDIDWINSDKNEFNEYIKSLLISDKLEIPMMEQLDFLYNESPVKLTSNYSVVKWLSFNLAYQGLTFEGWYDNKTIWRAKETVKPFFASDKFQRYALKNIDKVLTTNNFKSDALEYIKSKTELYITNYKLIDINNEKTDLRFIRDDYKPFRDIGID